MGWWSLPVVAVSSLGEAARAPGEQGLAEEAQEAALALAAPALAPGEAAAPPEAAPGRLAEARAALEPEPLLEWEALPMGEWTRGCST